MNVLNFCLDLFNKLSDGAKVLYNFLFSVVEIGNYEVSMWGLIGGASLSALIIYSCIK